MKLRSLLNVAALTICLSVEGANSNEGSQQPKVTQYFSTNHSALTLTAAKQRKENTVPRYRVSEVGPDSRTLALDDDGENARSVKVVEIETGMHFLDAGVWKPSEAVFREDQRGFRASKTQHKVVLSKQLNRPEAVTLETPDGKILKSTPVAIGLFDAVSGRSAILAELRDTTGILVAPNKVIYENAFVGNGVEASIVYTLEKGSFEQDVLLTSHVDPADFNFPPETTQIQVFTEFYNPPAAEKIRRPIKAEGDEKKRAKMNRPDLIDETIG